MLQLPHMLLISSWQAEGHVVLFAIMVHAVLWVSVNVLYAFEHVIDGVGATVGDAVVFELGTGDAVGDAVELVDGGM